MAILHGEIKTMDMNALVLCDDTVILASGLHTIQAVTAPECGVYLGYGDEGSYLIGCPDAGTAQNLEAQLMAWYREWEANKAEGERR